MWRPHRRAPRRDELAPLTRSYDRNLPVVVTVVAVGVVKVPVDEVVDVVAVGDRLVSAALAVDVIAVMPFAVVVGRAAVGVPRVDVQGVLVDVVLVRMMQVSAVDVVDVVAVLDRGVPAAGLVPVLVVLVGDVLGHGTSLRDRCPGDKQMRTRSVLRTRPRQALSEGANEKRSQNAPPSARTRVGDLGRQ